MSKGLQMQAFRVSGSRRGEQSGEQFSGGIGGQDARDAVGFGVRARSGVRARTENAGLEPATTRSVPGAAAGFDVALLGYKSRGGLFEDTTVATVATAVLDRLLHHASVLSVTGDSYRMRRHRDAIQAL